MSRAEPAAVLGVISSIVAIVEAVQKIYDAAKDSRGIDQTFRSVPECIPFTLGILRDAETVQAGAIDSLARTKDIMQESNIVEISGEVGPIVNAYKVDVQALKDIFQQAVPETKAQGS